MFDQLKRHFKASNSQLANRKSCDSELLSFNTVRVTNDSKASKVRSDSGPLLAVCIKTR